MVSGIALGGSALCQQYEDIPYLQDYAEKYASGDEDPVPVLKQVCSDRNHNIQVLSRQGLLQPWNSALVPDQRYRPLSDMHILALEKYRDQFVYMTDKAILSNAWAGKFYVEHRVTGPLHFVMGDDFSFLIASREGLFYFENGQMVWKHSLDAFNPVELLFDRQAQSFIILSRHAIHTLHVPDRKLTKVYAGKALTAMAPADGNRHLVVGTEAGILTLDRTSFAGIAPLNTKLPGKHITAIENIGGRLWFGSSRGAFALREDGKFDYYASRRWLVDDRVIDISAGPGRSVLVLTGKGLSRINFTMMTLEEKANRFQEIQRLRHIRYGFSSETNLLVPGDLSTAVLTDTDNDGLWTSMYLAGELFRYASTGSEDALQNAYEAFEAMERLTAISGIRGFPARTYEVDGYQSSDTDPAIPEDQKIWRLNEDRWRWKSTTSSDESCGHFFVYALFAEMVPDREWRERAIHQIQIEMDHIIEHDWYLVTWNGEITRWGRWNPDYVNSFPVNVGDRRLNSTLILAFLQTAYHFTGKEIYKEKAYELMNRFGYLENVLRPASKIGYVEGQILSDAWNHSDDEMYFLTVPALIKYAFTDKLRNQYMESVRSHWEVERSEKNPLWNFMYALAGGPDYDLDASVWWLKEFPLDLVSWNIENRHRRDLTPVAPNFRGQEYSEILPMDERPMHLHNGAYRNNGGSNGSREYPPYIYLLPYWLGRYVEAIGPPQN